MRWIEWRLKWIIISGELLFQCAVPCLSHTILYTTTILGVLYQVAENKVNQLGLTPGLRRLKIGNKVFRLMA